MFSIARFNVTKLNIAAAINKVLLRAVFSDMLTAHMGISTEYPVDAMTFSELLEHQSVGAAAIPAAYDLAEVLGTRASALLASPVELLFADSVDASSIYIKADHFHSGTMADSIDAKGTAGVHIWFASVLSDALAADAVVGAKIASEHGFSEILSVQPELSALEEQVLLIRVTLPAGSELRIDSENYTVTLDGENILHLQEGDWLALDRELVSLTLDSGTGSPLEGEMIYQERYL